LHCGGRGLLFWNAQGGPSHHYWGAQNALSVARVFAGAAKMGKQSLLGGYEAIVTGDGILVFAGLPGLVAFPRHGGKKRKGSGGAVVVKGDSNGA
jgi:hypothetical protein